MSTDFSRFLLKTEIDEKALLGEWKAIKRQIEETFEEGCSCSKKMEELKKQYEGILDFYCGLRRVGLARNKTLNRMIAGKLYYAPCFINVEKHEASYASEEKEEEARIKQHWPELIEIFQKHFPSSK